MLDQNKKVSQNFQEKSAPEKGTFWEPLGGNNKNRIGANAGLMTYIGEKEDGSLETINLLFDAGSMMGDNSSPEDHVLVNCDTVIPDLSKCFYDENDPEFVPKNPVDAIFLTHSHLDHLDALPYMSLMGKKIPPIYATPYTAKRLYQAYSNQNIPPEDWPDVTEIAPGQKIIHGSVAVTPFSVSHSTPQSVGYYIETPNGNILQPGDFKLDQTLTWGPGFKREQFDRIVKNGVDLLLLDSTGADKDMAPVTEEDVRDSLRALMEKYKYKRFVITSMGGFEESLASIAKVASEFGRDLWVAGWSHEQALSALGQTGLTLSDHVGRQVKVKTVSPGKSARDLEEALLSKTVVVTTGAQGRNNAILTRAADGQSTVLKLDPKRDIVLFCAPSIPGVEKTWRDRLVAKLRALKMRVFTNQDMKLYSHGHARLPEILEMVDIAKPRVVMPVHGDEKLREANYKAVKNAGYRAIKVENNQRVQVTRRGSRIVRNFVKRWIGIKTQSGNHWQDRDYHLVYAPQKPEIAAAEANKKRGKAKPRIFTQHERLKNNQHHRK